MTQITKLFFKVSIAALAVLFINTPASSQNLNNFTSQQAVDFASKNAYQVKNALLDVLIQQQSNREITGAAFPQIAASGSFTDYLDIPTSLLPGEVFGQPAGTFIPVRFGTKYTSSGGVTLNQLLFDGQVFVGLQARKTSIDLRQKTTEVTLENIKANVLKIYYQLVLSRTQIALLDANIVRLQKLEHDTKEIYKNGFAEKLDVDKLAVQLINLQTERQKVLNSVNNGYNGLKVLIGMPVKDSLVLTDTLSEQQIKEGILESTQYNYADRKDYQLLELGKKLNQYNVKRYQLSQIPTLSAVANYSKQAQRNKFDFFKKGGDWFTTSYVGLNLSIPIFKGFATKAKIAQAKLAVQQTDNQIENLQRIIDNDVQTARNNFANATSTMDYQKKNMELAELVYNQTKKKYEIGTGSSTEITTAETDLKTAQTNYINALYDAIIARVDLLKAVGKL